MAANIKNSLLWKEKHEHRQQQIVKADGGSGDDDLKENGGQRKERRLKSTDTAIWKLLPTYIPDMVSKPRGVSTFPLLSILCSRAASHSASHSPTYTCKARQHLTGTLARTHETSTVEQSYETSRPPPLTPCLPPE